MIFRSDQPKRLLKSFLSVLGEHACGPAELSLKGQGVAELWACQIRQEKPFNPPQGFPVSPSMA